MVRGEGLILTRFIPSRAVASEVRSIVRNLWPAYACASILILLGFQWGMPDPPLVPRSWQADENAIVWAVGQMSFPFFDPK